MKTTRRPKKRMTGRLNAYSIGTPIIVNGRIFEVVKITRGTLTLKFVDWLTGRRRRGRELFNRWLVR